MAVTKEQVLFVFTHMSYTVNFIETERDCGCPGIGLRIVGRSLGLECLASGDRVLVWKDEVLEADSGDGCTTK